MLVDATVLQICPLSQQPLIRTAQNMSASHWMSSGSVESQSCFNRSHSLDRREHRRLSPAEHQGLEFRTGRNRIQHCRTGVGSTALWSSFSKRSELVMQHGRRQNRPVALAQGQYTFKFSQDNDNQIPSCHITIYHYQSAVWHSWLLHYMCCMCRLSYNVMVSDPICGCCYTSPYCLLPNMYKM